MTVRSTISVTGHDLKLNGDSSLTPINEGSKLKVSKERLGKLEFWSTRVHELRTWSKVASPRVYMLTCLLRIVNAFSVRH